MIFLVNKLKRSNDRKVANSISPNGKTPNIANTFGLPAGKDYSCPNATSVCSSVCYAGKLEKLYAIGLPSKSLPITLNAKYSPLLKLPMLAYCVGAIGGNI